MIHRVKTVTWEVRSHRQVTTISSEGRILDEDWDDCCLMREWGKPNVKRMIKHLQDVLKCMRRIEKEKQARKERQANENLSK